VPSTPLTSRRATQLCTVEKYGVQAPNYQNLAVREQCCGVVVSGCRHAARNCPLGGSWVIQFSAGEDLRIGAFAPGDQNQTVRQHCGGMGTAGDVEATSHRPSARTLGLCTSSPHFLVLAKSSLSLHSTLWLKDKIDDLRFVRAYSDFLY
jgi:hypothetical protein